MLQTVSDFLLNVARRSFMPSGQSTFTDAEILTIASEELRSVIMPALYSINEEYGVYHKTTTTTANIAEYDIPEQAYNNTLREVQLLISNDIRDLTRTSLEKAKLNSIGMPYSFYMRSNRVVLYPTPNSSEYSIKLWYQLTPPLLVNANETCIINAIDTITNVVSVTNIPSDWVTGDRLDFICKKAGHVHKGIDYTSTLISGSDITFSTLPSDLSVGDYVSVTGESSLINLPYAMIPVLAQFTAASLLEYAGQDGAKEAQGKAREMLQAAIKSLTPRIAGETQFIHNPW